MKKSMLVVLCLMVVVALVGVQPAHAGTKGLKAGVTMMKFTGSDANFETISPSYRTGFAFGAYLAHPLTPTLSFQPEAYYAMKGAKYEEGGDTMEFKLNYLQIPLLLKMQPVGGKAFFYAGPDVGINLNAKVKAEFDGVSVETDLDDVKSLDFGLTFGAGMDLNKISLEARYTIGMSSIDDSANADSIKNSGLMVLVGLGL